MLFSNLENLTKQPLISIITPVYNSESFLRECIDSVLAQTCDNWELILVDDGSTDNSGCICDEYAEIDSRVSVIHKKNSGQFLSRLNGIESARGVYCTGLDSDDYLSKDFVKKLSELLVDCDYDIVTWNLLAVNYRKEFLRITTSRYGNYTREEFLEYVSGSADHSFCDKLIRTALLRNSEYGYVPNSIRYSEDYILIAPALCMAKRIFVSNEDLYYYRQVDNSVTHMYTTKRVLDNLESIACVLSIFREYSALSPSLADIEYRNLVSTVGYCLKQSYKNGNVSESDIKRIYAHPLYRKMYKYERVRFVPRDTAVFLMLFRLRLGKLLSLLYS